MSACPPSKGLKLTLPVFFSLAAQQRLDRTQIKGYLQLVCAAPSCSRAVIDNTTAQVWAGCDTDLSRNDIDQDELREFMDAYPTARNVSCLTSNTATNSTSNSTSNSTLCTVTLLQQQETYLGRNLSTQYLAGLLLNSTHDDADDSDNDFTDDLDDLFQYLWDPSVAKNFLCNDCAQAAADVILQNYPDLAMKEFDLDGNDTDDDGSDGRDDDDDITIPLLFQTVCGISVGPNITLPASVNSTAYDEDDDDDDDDD